MKLIKDILVAVELKDNTDSVISNSMIFAKRFHAKITFIHVLPDNIGDLKITEKLKEVTKGKLKALNEKMNQEGIETGDFIIASGNKSEKVILTSESIGANLIMLGAGEKQVEDAYQLGTTAGKIIRKSRVPVLVIKNNQVLEGMRHILCPIDFSEQSSNALNHAIAIARIFNSKLIILNVYTEFIYDLPEINANEINQQRKAESEERLKHFLSNHSLIDVNYNTVVVGGSPSKKILEAIESHQADLLLMGTTGKSGISKILLGSVAEKVTREVLCSFITLKKESFLSFEIKAKTLLEYYQAAEKLYQEGFYEKAIHLYNKCLEINFSHIKSLKGLAKAHKKLGNESESIKYNKLANNFIEQMNNLKIENEVRRTLNT